MQKIEQGVIRKPNEVVKGLSYSKNFGRYLDLLVDLAVDLPFCFDFNSDEKDPKFDSFIRKYALKKQSKDYLSLADKIKTVSIILDAKSSFDSAYETYDRVKKDDYWHEDTVKELKKHCDDCHDALFSQLKIAYSGEGQITDKPFDVLYSDFFSKDRMVKINEAIQIKTNVIDKKYDKSEFSCLGFPSVRFGNLAAEVRQ
jgi:hypothetical protein